MSNVFEMNIQFGIRRDESCLISTNWVFNFIRKQQTAAQQPAPAQAYNSTAYPAAPSPNALYSGQYMVDAGVQNIIGMYRKLYYTVLEHTPFVD